MAVISVESNQNLPTETMGMSTREQLAAIDARMQRAYRVLFGVQVNSTDVSYVTPSVTENSVGSFIHTVKQLLEEKQTLLMEAGKVGQSMSLDIRSEGQPILTDLERALDFLDASKPNNNNPVAVSRTMEHVFHYVQTHIEDLSPIPGGKPSIVFPRGVLTTPIFGFFDQSIWAGKKAAVEKATKKRIEEIRQIIQRNISGAHPSNLKRG